MSSYTPVTVTLADEKKWKDFHPKTEMIVTKKKGRCLFPHLDFLINGLDKNSLYTMQIHLQRVDNIKYKFDQGEWKEAAKGDPILPIKHVEHADGARTGEHWMSDKVSFASLKITNDPKNENQKLVLVQSMHKYQPILTVTRLGDDKREQFRLELTEFMVVTAYQNEEVIKLKVGYNKFASGFRSNGKRRASGDSDNQNQDPAAKRVSPDWSSSSSSSVSPTAWTPAPSSTSYAPFFPTPPAQFPMMDFSNMYTPPPNYNSFPLPHNYANMPFQYPNQDMFMNMWNINMPPATAQPPIDTQLNPYGP